jgi:hypothetical protein
MDKVDHDWFNGHGRLACPNLTHLEYETIVDKLENASTRTLISLDEARTLLPNVDTLHLTTVYTFWRERRTAKVGCLPSCFSFASLDEGKDVVLNISDMRMSEILTVFFFLSWFLLPFSIDLLY